MGEVLTVADSTRQELETHLPNPPGAIRRWLAEHPRAVDNFILVCFLIGALPLAVFSIYTVADTAPSLGWVVAYATLVCVRITAGVIALTFRRRAPLLGLILVTLALIGDTSPVVAANGVALWFMLYAVPVYRNVKAGWVAYGIAVLGAVSSAAIRPWLADIGGFAATTGLGPGSAIFDALWLLVVLLVGINLGNQRRYLQAIIDRANQLARERDQLAMLAVAEERSRLAREIHDIVAHSVSVMIALSEGGARAIETAPKEAANAMLRSAETGRTALTEMRRLLGALQSDEVAELAPQPGITNIPELLRGFEDAGLAISFLDEGVDRADRLQSLTVYRVVQEGLTNVLRYAGKGARVEVSLHDTGDGITISVRDFGRVPGTSGPATGLGSGRGLTGLAERVRVFGGSIESGPVPGEPGWMLRATIPYESHASAEIEEIE